MTKSSVLRFLGLKAFFVVLIFFSSVSSNAKAQTIIRDTEIETALAVWSKPLIQAAGLSPGAVQFVLVQSPDVNAFVAGGQNIFLFTGLIDKTETVDELLAVIAHELGHISGGHLVRTRQALENASYESILGTVLGIGAAIATRDGAAAGAISGLSRNTAERRFLTHSRTHESSADQAALTFMRNAQMDPAGLITFFEKLQDQELVPVSQQIEYVRTHPLTANRIEAIRLPVKQSPYYGQGFPDDWQGNFKLIKAKLLAFLQPQSVSWSYRQNDGTFPARYARAIGAYRQNKEGEAIREIDALIALDQQNPYFHEMKGQMLSDFGRLDAAEESYERAVSLKPDAALMRIAYARVLIENGQSSRLKLQKAVTQLKEAQRTEQRSTRLHRLLATAYGRLGDEARAGLHLAEEALLQGRKDYARQRIQAVANDLPNGSADWYRAQDIINFLNQS